VKNKLILPVQGSNVSYNTSHQERAEGLNLKLHLKIEPSVLIIMHIVNKNYTKGSG
jgi:hypothetical protein